MNIYDIIYNFYYTYIFAGDSDFLTWSFPIDTYHDGEYVYAGLTGQAWLCDTFTIITLILIVIVLIRVVIWCFSLFTNLLGGRR